MKLHKYLFTNAFLLLKLFLLDSELIFFVSPNQSNKIIEKQPFAIANDWMFLLYLSKHCI
jgi:hypothetical protein